MSYQFMANAKPIHLVVTAMLVLAVQGALAQTGPVSGVYQILSGRYNECCGFSGSETGYDLPSPNQIYVKLTIYPQSGLGSMTFLGADMQTVFSRMTCPAVAPLDFTFHYGSVSSDGIVFHVDPGAPPYALTWSYTVSNSANSLRITGVLSSLQSPCADVPTQFRHSNVVAVLIPVPALKVLGFSSAHGAQLLLQGHAGHTNVIEASTDLITWNPVSTNLMDYSLCPICPYFLFEDASSTNRPYRFYRAFEVY